MTTSPSGYARPIVSVNGSPPAAKSGPRTTIQLMNRSALGDEEPIEHGADSARQTRRHGRERKERGGRQRYEVQIPDVGDRRERHLAGRAPTSYQVHAACPQPHDRHARPSSTHAPAGSPDLRDAHGRAPWPPATSATPSARDPRRSAWSIRSSRARGSHSTPRTRFRCHGKAQDPLPRAIDRHGVGSTQTRFRLSAFQAGRAQMEQRHLTEHSPRGPQGRDRRRRYSPVPPSLLQPAADTLRKSWPATARIRCAERDRLRDALSRHGLR